MNRREILKTALAGAGAVTSAAGQESEHAAHANKQASGPAPKAPWQPLLFDTHQNATVATLAELIIPRTDTPGARDAKVHMYIDLILHDGPDERRTRFLQGLGALDGQAIREHGQPFVGLTEAQQVAMLKGLDANRSDFFRQIKQLTVQGYYTSQEGIAELNKGGRVPSGIGCAHEGKH